MKNGPLDHYKKQFRNQLIEYVLRSRVYHRTEVLECLKEIHALIEGMAESLDVPDDEFKKAWIVGEA